MKIKCKWFEKKVDERQEMDLLKVEHFGFWMMYYMLLIAILIQTFFFKDGLIKMAAAEWIIFMSASIICLIGCIRKGVWSYHTRKIPGVRSCLLYSIFTAIIVGVPFGLAYSFKWNDTGFWSIAERIIIFVISLFFISFTAFLILGTLAKRRETKLADQCFDDEDEEEN